MDFYKEALKLHQEHRGKIEVVSKVPLNTRDDMSVAYTPGVAEPCREIHKDRKNVYRYTAKGNLVAVVSDGSAVLGPGKHRRGGGHPGDGGQIRPVQNSSAAWTLSPSVWTPRIRRRSSGR